MKQLDMVSIARDETVNRWEVVLLRWDGRCHELFQ